VGSSIDIFEENLSQQTSQLTDPDSLPYDTRINLGEELLDLHVNPIFDDHGTYIYAALSLSVVKEIIKTEDDTTRLDQMIELMPISAMICDPESFNVTYANDTCIKTLSTIEQHLSINAVDLVGSNIDVFNNALSQQFSMLSDPKNLPWNTRTDVGTEALDLQVSAIHNRDGSYLAPMITISIVTHEVSAEKAVQEAISSVHTEAEQLQGSAKNMQENAENSIRLSGAISASAEQTSLNSQTVAAATEELSASVDEIGKQVMHASKISLEAEAKTEETIKIVSSLSEVSSKIGNVVNLINDIAAQTNLLALNATIEAARAGEAGRGFAVVASEVKNLAGQTATATVDIKEQVESIQSETESVVAAIEIIQGTVKQVNEISADISQSVEEQSGATREISANVQEAARGAQEVSSSISEVLAASNSTGEISGNILTASDLLVSFADGLNDEVGKIFKK
ncbi:MAG: methyl-accepting chemotaxis protein, partial [Emcibacteraceae bacterium]|nr:methyl-accepting chemotaxis protein [Emcibacteraceae bacterium]